MPTIATKDTTMFSLDVVKGYLGVSLTETSVDALIKQIADGVSEKFEQKTQRYIVTRTGLTDRWNGNGKRSRFLSRMDVTTLTSLTVDGTAVDPATVALDGHVGLIQLLDTAAVSAFQAGIANCVAVFTCGLGAQDAAALPSDVLEACLEWAKALYDEKVSGATAASTVSLGPANIVLKPGLSHHIKATIDAWVDVRS